MLLAAGPIIELLKLGFYQEANQKWAQFNIK